MPEQQDLPKLGNLPARTTRPAEVRVRVRDRGNEYKY